MKITFYGACSEVGRNCFLLEFNGKRILLDAGMDIAAEGKGRYPTLPLGIARKINAIVISHAHLDHTGFLPFIVKAGFRGKIYATKTTRDLMHLLLSDAVKIAKEEKQKFYSGKDVEKTMKLIEAEGFGEWIKLFKGAKLKFYNAGHIPGSALVLLELGEKRVLYTGDFSSRESNLLNAVNVPKEKIGVLVMEGTYAGKGDSIKSLSKAAKELADIIKGVMRKKGKVLVPVFAVGRGQEIMFTLENYIRSGYLPELNVYIDGMIARANKICRHNVIYLRDEIGKRILLADDDPFKSRFLKRPKTKTKADVLKGKNVVILATSGMLSAGPALGYFKKLAKSKKNAIVLVGYQVEGSLGRELLDGKRKVEVDGRKVKVNCAVERVQFSGHADYNGLLNFARSIRAKKVFIVHSEGDKAKGLASALEKEAKCRAFVPKCGEELAI